jgi:ADP-ribose pyrophosphatase YjhB (NUDIX family)
MTGKRYDTFAEYLKHEHKGPYTANDIIIRYDNGMRDGVVLIERKGFPYGLAWPGGMAEHMTWHENAVKEAKEETGLDIIIDDIERPLCALSGLDGDPRAHIATVVYTAKGYGILRPDPKEDAKNAIIVNNDELYSLTLQQNTKKWAFQRHQHIAEIYLKYIGYDKRQG